MRVALNGDLSGLEPQVGTALDALVHAGQAEGDIHPDVTVTDFSLLLGNVAADGTPESAARWLTLVLPGLTTQGRPVD
ncbi:hypothetical protein [Kitasatospora sp. NPDC015120]|uniref:SbtR family transcriptional regulator n=1 Tax=Kitasatospora sp. NPDC015120 TaxID=3364023 RepID=UPI0036F478DD